MALLPTIPYHRDGFVTRCSHSRSDNDSGKMLNLEEILSSLESGKITSPSVHYLASISKKCQKDKNGELGSRFHAYVQKCGLETHPSLGNCLVSMLVDVGKLQDAQMVFEKLDFPSEFAWTSLISGFIRCGKPQHALMLYEKVVGNAVIQPSGHTYVAVLKACAKLKNLEKGIEIHAKILREGRFDQNIFISNSLIDMYAKCGSLARSRKAFDRLRVRDVVSWNAMITAYVTCDVVERALDCLNLMQQEGVCPNDVTLICILKACRIIGDVDKGQETHAKIMGYGLLETEPAIASTLVSMYAKSGFFAKAREVFDNLKVRSVTSWTALITGYVDHDQNERALDCFDDMQKEGVSPNVVTFLCCLKACGNLGAMNKGEEIYLEILRRGLLEEDQTLGNMVISMFSKCGSLTRAQEVFDKLQDLDVVSWSALIAGYGQLGEHEVVFTLFDSMIQKDIKADHVTFISILNTCCHAGLIERGSWYFDVMRKDYGIAPILEHYTCMVDLHGRAGQLEKALIIIQEMPFVPDSTIWKTLLTASRKSSNVVFGKLAFSQATGLDVIDSGAYMCMSDIFADD